MRFVYVFLSNAFKFEDSYCSYLARCHFSIQYPTLFTLGLVLAHGGAECRVPFCCCDYLVVAGVASKRKLESEDQSKDNQLISFILGHCAWVELPRILPCNTFVSLQWFAFGGWQPRN